jgi:hypothetical protein
MYKIRFFDRCSILAVEHLCPFVWEPIFCCITFEESEGPPGAVKPVMLMMKMIFRQVIQISYNFVCFLLGNSPASEFYMPTFRNTLSIFKGL